MPRCSAAGLDFRIIPAGFNAPLEFLTGFTYCVCINELRKSNGTLSNLLRPPHPPLSPDYGGEDKGEGVNTMPMHIPLFMRKAIVPELIS
jgi:hypothetical protein